MVLLFTSNASREVWALLELFLVVLLGTGMIATHRDNRIGLFGLVCNNLLGVLRFITVKDDWNMLYKLCFCAIKMVLLFIKVRYYKVLQRSYFWESKRCKNHGYRCSAPSLIIIIVMITLGPVSTKLLRRR